MNEIEQLQLLHIIWELILIVPAENDHMKKNLLKRIEKLEANINDRLEFEQTH